MTTRRDNSHRHLSCAEATRRAQFGLRTMLLASVAIGVSLGLLGRSVHRLWCRQLVVSEVTELGGRVTYDYFQRYGFEPPRWLRDRLGDRWIGVPVAVDCRRRKLSLETLSHLPGLRMLSVEYCGITDGELAHLSALRNLTVLSLRGNQVTDASVKHLLALAQLNCLDLTDTQVTEQGLEQLRTNVATVLIRSGSRDSRRL